MKQLINSLHDFHADQHWLEIVELTDIHRSIAATIVKLPSVIRSVSGQWSIIENVIWQWKVRGIRNRRKQSKKDETQEEHPNPILITEQWRIERKKRKKELYNWSQL